MKAEERYQQDWKFRVLMDSLYNLIAGGHYTPTELREALILALTHYEVRTQSPGVLALELLTLRGRFVEQDEAGE